MASAPPTIEPSDISPISIVEEMKTSYLDYAMSVIVARALPDVRDGLKPVHRRILYACQEGGFVAGRPYRKSAKIVGDVMGNYHPHGDSAIYDALARMTQDWSMRVPLIDGQGNFGSMDPDPPASMRYTEARLAKVAMTLLDDLDKDTVDFTPNYDGSREEPQVLPARFPNLLVNGAGGIAVGMATNIPPHNLGEVIAACKAYIDNPAITIDELIEIIPGARFPDRAADPRPGRRPRRLSYRPRLDHDARPPRDRGRPRRPPLDRAHLDPLPGRQERPGREDRRGRQGQADRGHLRHSRRIEPRGRARRHRPEARRHARRRAQPALAAHARPSRASRPTCSRSAAAGPRR